MIGFGALLLLIFVSFSQQYQRQSGSVFEIQEFKANWFKAFEHCRSLGMRLAVIDSKTAETKLAEAIMSSTIYIKENTLVWMGADDLAEEGKFYWHDTGREVGYSNWYPGMPDNARGNENCVEFGHHKYDAKMFMKWQWNDNDCSMTHYFVCERQEQELMVFK